MTPTLPPLPTDNLYKFYAISGLSLILTSIIFYYLSYNEIYSDIDKLKLDVALTEVDASHIKFDVGEMEKKLQKASDANPILKSKVNLDSLQYASFYALKEALIKDKNLRDYYEFQFKYEDKLVPGLSESNERGGKIEALHKLNRELEKRVAIISTKSTLITSKNDRMFQLGIILSLCLAAGGALTRYGFSKWQKLVQNPIDEKLSLELEDLRRRLANSSTTNS